MSSIGKQSEKKTKARMSNEQERRQLEYAMRHYAFSQSARDVVLLSVIAMTAPQDLGTHYAIALKARWPFSEGKFQLRAFVAIQDQGKQWWFLGLPDEWLAIVAEEVAKPTDDARAKP
jgi:hypothetical protein